MWLLPAFSAVARAASLLFYRMQFAGDEVPATGPVLLVANHPNSLLDPMLVVAAARRPVRFLAKAPLFDDARIGWAVKAVGAIPVYRRQDDATQMDRNADMFRAAYDVLGQGGAVGLFPEGISHNQPGMVPLKTGAARLALGAAARVGRAFPIVPVGIVLRDKAIFASEALSLRGARVAWDDLAGRGPDDAEAVHRLTGRIDDALRAVTVNLAAWEDGPLVECAVRIWEAERDEPSLPAERVVRLGVTTRILATLRSQGGADGAELARDIESYRRRLQRFGLRPSDVTADVRLSRGVAWAARRLHLLGPLQLVVALAGTLLFWLPYRLTGMIVDRLPLSVDLRSTYKLFVGMVVYLTWIVAVAVSAGLALGALWGVSSAVVVPAVGVYALLLLQHWQFAWRDARRFFVLRSRRELVAAMRERQRLLGARLDQAYRAFVDGGAV